MDRVNNISKGNVLKIARKLVGKLQIDKPPIVMNDLLKTINPKVKVVGEDLGKDDGLSTSKPLIVYNSNKPKTRSRFTVAHELGHILLGHSSTRRSISYYDSNTQENEANIFASELLVPLSMLKNENFLLTSLSALSKKYWVSREMMTWRLKETNLYTKIHDWN